MRWITNTLTLLLALVLLLFIDWVAPEALEEAAA